MKIKKISKISFSGEVYDLQVGSGTYNIEGIAVHNSAGGSLVCYLIGIHSIDPLLWGTSTARFLSPARGGYMLNVSLPKN